MHAVSTSSSAARQLAILETLQAPRQRRHNPLTLGSARAPKRQRGDRPHQRVEPVGRAARRQARRARSRTSRLPAPGTRRRGCTRPCSYNCATGSARKTCRAWPAPPSPARSDRPRAITARTMSPPWLTSATSASAYSLRHNAIALRRPALRRKPAALSSAST